MDYPPESGSSSPPYTPGLVGVIDPTSAKSGYRYADFAEVGRPATNDYRDAYARTGIPKVWLQSAPLAGQ
jgi:hypothetical protein